MTSKCRLAEENRYFDAYTIALCSGLNTPEMGKQTTLSCAFPDDLRLISGGLFSSYKIPGKEGKRIHANTDKG